MGRCIVHKSRKESRQKTDGSDVKKTFPKNTFGYNHKNIESALTFFRDFNYNMMPGSKGHDK